MSVQGYVLLLIPDLSCSGSHVGIIDNSLSNRRSDVLFLQEYPVYTIQAGGSHTGCPEIQYLTTHLAKIRYAVRDRMNYPDSMRTWKPRDFHDFLDVDNDVCSTSVCSSKSRGIHVATRQQGDIISM
jgi:hypothetical protein